MKNTTSDSLPATSNDNSSRKAVALKYDGKSAPTVTATGFDDVADAIIALAKDHNVPLFENPELVKLLGTIDLGDEIPETLYLCIAQILSFAYHLQNKTPDTETTHTNIP